MKLEFYHSVSFMRHKKAVALSNFIEKKAHSIFLFTNFFDKKKYLIKSLLNQWIKITLDQRLNKPLDKHYRQVAVYAIRLCVNY